jgi:hypothetical protein
MHECFTFCLKSENVNYLSQKIIKILVGNQRNTFRYFINRDRMKTQSQKCHKRKQRNSLTVHKTIDDAILTTVEKIIFLLFKNLTSF